MKPIEVLMLSSLVLLLGWFEIRLQRTVQRPLAILQDRLTAIELQTHELRAIDSMEPQPISIVDEVAELPVFQGNVLNAGNEKDGKSTNPIHSNAAPNPDDIVYLDHSDDVTPTIRPIVNTIRTRSGYEQEQAQ